ncbi:hypothetical protein AU184_02410 [Mycolicibacterium novocastrense]|nr:hypothetical protein AU072_04905 [Mycolicibacterium novocastrense]KUH72525.1 hypothetical protein AU184_02410 [Mycolicibacterium novocastrense]KUH78513.1 hypothetical protein AU183_08185 [Mycolicibacterium novocastrense]
MPEGSTSYYFRTRTALIRAVAERVAELDLAELRSVTAADVGTSVMKLAADVMKSLTALLTVNSSAG